MQVTLTHAAAKLYLYLLWNAGGMRDDVQVRRGAGIADRRTLLHAWADLVAQGLLNPATGVVIIPTSPRNDYQVPSNHYQVPSNDYHLDRSEPSNDYHPPSNDYQIPSNDYQVPSDDYQLDEEAADWAQEAARLDGMAGDGDERNPHSPFQVRRRAQIALLTRAWAAFFPQQRPLQPLAAKQLLVAAHAQATTVVECMQTSAERGVEYPLAYTRKLVESARPLPPPASTVNDGDLRPVTDAMRAQWAKMEGIADQLGIDWRDDDE